MNILVTICARGGSKGVPNKNIRTINQKPLIAYTIECANFNPNVIGIAVSSDDPNILDCARKHGANWLITRPSAGWCVFRSQ